MSQFAKTAELSAEKREKIRSRGKSKARRADTIGHLGPEAVVAFVDDEMDSKAMHRARIHLVHCDECRDEIYTQRGTSEWVRHCNIESQVRAPRDLLRKLASIGNLDARDRSFSMEEEQEPATRQDFFDKLEMVVRAIKHNQRGNE
jgi:uncharacterized protein YlaI